MMHIDRFTAIYRNLDKHNLSSLEELYAEDVCFQDPAHILRGRQTLLRYFEQLYANVTSCHFAISSAHQDGDAGFVVWEMNLQHPSLNRGNVFTVHGCSHLLFRDGLVEFHRDYFDLGEMLYERLPFIGRVVRKIKQRLGQ